MRPDTAFKNYVVSHLAGLPGVRAVTLGGSRATGKHGPDSDWDFAVYYRGAFSPGDLRALGWPGQVSEIGGWGGGVFNGGAWLQVDGRKVDVHYRDLDDVEHHQVLSGDLPRPAYPDALRAAAPPRWWRDAQATLGYGRAAYAAHGRLTETAGTLGVAACQAGHAVLAASGQWVTNEKTLLDRAGLRGLDQILAGLTPDPDALTGAVDAAGAYLRAAVARAGDGAAAVRP
jgi:predicted nucleotidyltransferase